MYLLLLTVVNQRLINDICRQAAESKDLLFFMHSCMRADVAHKNNLALGFLKLRRISGVQLRRVTAIMTLLSM